MTRSIRCTLIAFFLSAGVPAGANGVVQSEADALFADGEWAGAAAAYELLLDQNPEHATNWFRLGQARMQLEDYAIARDAYLAAIEAGYEPGPRVQFHLARALAALGEHDAALDRLEALSGTAGITNQTLLGTAEFAGLVDMPRYQALLAALTPCTAPEYRAFDFWLGTWDVQAAGSTGPAASNRISSEQGGCVVLEQYQNQGFTGMSINFYDQVTGKWHQTWMSNSGGAVYLEGGLDERGAMVMTDADLPVSEVSGTTNRVTWTPNEDGSVRQHWESSSDGGETWATVFDGTYTRAAD